MTTRPAPDVLVATRQSLHRVAEHLLAAARKRDSGQITLLPGPGGFRTPPLGAGTVLAVVGTDLVVLGRAGERRAPLTTLADAAAFAGVEPGFPWTKHPPTTPFEPAAPLDIDQAAAQVLAEWFALGHEALTGLAAAVSGEQPSDPQIFPEHFDLGVTAGRVNFGFSPGDEDIPEPYAYIGPHDGPPSGVDFWNASFGACRTRREVTTAEEALTFFRAGRAALDL